jgi:4-hydroxy-tetrahydrodipicolinate synthase
VLTDGCDGVALLGTTGEANSLALAERQALVEAAVVAGIPAQKLMPGTGLCAIPETVALTRHALSLGITRVVMLPPFYYKNQSDDGLFAAYAAVIDKVADTRLRIILYHFPQMSAVPFSLVLIERLLRAFPGTIAGIKDSSGNLDNMLKMIRNFPGFAVFAGADPLMMPALAEGGAGCITAAANLIARDLATVFRHLDNPSQAATVARAQQRIVETRRITTQYAQIPAVKALIAQRYNDNAWRSVRPPLTALDNTARQQVECDFAKLT